MKKLICVLLTLSLLLGTGPAALASSQLPDNSAYDFKFALPDYIVTDKETAVGVTLKTAVLGEEGYEDAYIQFSATGPGSVNLAKDSDNTYVNQGSLPDFDLPARYNVTTDWNIIFTEEGTYTITFKLYDADDNVLTKKTQEFKVSDGVFLYTVPKEIYEDAEFNLGVTFITEQDYEDVHFAFAKTSGAGDVLLRGQDEDGRWYSLKNSGDLKPASFDIDGSYSKSKTYKLEFSKPGTYEIAFKLVDEDGNVLVKDSKNIVVKRAPADKDDDEDEDEDKDKDKDKAGKGRTHGLLNALRNHLKIKKNGKSPSDSQSVKRLMELLEDRGLAEDLLENLKDAIAELEEAISELEAAIAANYEDSDNFRALAKMKRLKGKKYETYIDGKRVNYEDAEPILINNRTLVPFRKLAEVLGAKVNWEPAKKEITVAKAGKEIIITIGKDTALVNGKKVKLDADALIYNNRTLVPLRFVAEALDATVDFYPEGDLISIKKCRI